MTISRTCRHTVSVPVLFWTSVSLLFLAIGVYSAGDEQQPRYDRYPRHDRDTDIQGYMMPEVQDSYKIMNLIRELIQRHQQMRNQQVQMNDNGGDLSENQIDWRKVPLPLLYQIRAIINDGAKEEDKRGSYMSLCHFKICNLG